MVSSGNSVANVAAHDHACVFYRSEAERGAAAGAFAQRALDERARLLYIVSDRPPKAVAAELDEGGVEVNAPLASGQLQVRTAEEAYLANGPFEPGPMIELLRDEARAAEADGWYGLRVAGEMDWALSDGSIEQLLAYEAAVDEVFQETGAAAICLYDGRAFQDCHCEDAARAHHLVLSAGERDPSAHWELARIERGKDGALAVAGEVDLSNADSFSASLQAEAARCDSLRLDLSELSFIDLSGIGKLCSVGSEVGARGGQVFLSRPPRSALTAFKLLQFDQLGWLHWEAS